MKNKATLLGIVAGAVCFLAAILLILNQMDRHTGQSPHADILFRTKEDAIQIQTEDGWEDFQIVGVNIGTGYPGTFPNEFGIDEETYLRWFKQIAEMHANTVRVYKLQPPEFYTAFAAYNAANEEKLYLIQGVDFHDDLMYTDKNILEPAQQKPLFRLTQQTVDAVHGDSIQLNRQEKMLCIYKADVSEYVLGYLLGVEWDSMCVEYVCRLNEGRNTFDGAYLSCEGDANPFEVFLAQWGDLLLRYEQEEYGVQGLLTYGNWPETDPLLNELKIHTERVGTQDRTEATVDVEHIHMTEKMRSGIFASYNVYPYFPDFMQYGTYTQAQYLGENRGPYYNYLYALTSHHSYPVVVTEYGIPTSRSRSYMDVWRNINHGGLDEKEQGENLVTLYRDIVDAGCVGAIVFTWQDEWYKTMWNEKLISDPDRRAYWSNAQCAEQFFGLVSFDPGDGERLFYPDGDDTEWQEEDEIGEWDGLKLSMYSDEKYVYFLVKGSTLNREMPLNLVLDVTPKSGQDQIGRIQLERPADFVIRLIPGKEAMLYVDEKYDLMPYSALGGYNDLSVLKIKNILEKGRIYTKTMDENPEFVTVLRAAGNIYGHLAGLWDAVDVGRLQEGNANPQSKQFNSNADYCYGDGLVELRIPWQLLNFRDPSKAVIVDDLRENEKKLENLKIKAIYATLYVDDTERMLSFAQYPLEGWLKPQWHERLKASYYILQDAFATAQ